MARSPEARLQRRVLNVLVGLIAFVGVSSSVSPWLEDLYGRVAVVVLILGLVVGAVVALAKLPDRALAREVRESWRQNAELVRERNERHMADPEVATRLAEQLLQEKLARQQMAGQPHVPPPAKG